MDSFGFTRKKFLSLPVQRRHRRLADWLEVFYQTLRTNRAGRERLSAFHLQYRTACAWMDFPCPEAPESGETLAWLIFVSDALQRHRQASGQVVRDHDLMARIRTGDRRHPPFPRPDMDYQVALDGIRSLFNVGSIMRTCEAAGIETVILGSCEGKENPRVRKTAMGAQDRIREISTPNLVRTLEEKKNRGFRIIGVETVEGAVPCHRYPWPQRAVLLVGNEEYGISPHVLSAVDDIVHLPVFGEKNSLNVANALSAVLYQAVFARMA